MRRLAMAVILTLALAGRSWGDTEPAPPRIVVPIAAFALSDGKIRYAIPVNVGRSSAIEAWLDTGSSGLRLLNGAVDERDRVITQKESSYRFGSGLLLTGVVAEAVVTIGGASTETAVPVQLIRSVGCIPEAPDCPAARAGAGNFLIGGDGLPNEGFKAVIGVNLADADAVNPLERIGARSWIIELPRPNETIPGRLILNPSQEDRAGFVPLQTDELLGRRRGIAFHDAVSGCLRDSDTQRQVCGPTLMDSGTQGIRVISGEPEELSGWWPGARMTLSLSAKNGSEASMSFVAGATDPSRITPILRRDQPRTHIMAGTLPYFVFSTLYDGRDGTIAVKSR